MSGTDVLGYVLNEFATLTKKPYHYLSVQENVGEQAKYVTKTLYDYTRQHEHHTENSPALPELIIEDFDDEQIWQEIELQNNFVWSHFLKNVSFCVAGKHTLKFPIEIPNTESSPDADENGISNLQGNEPMDLDKPLDKEAKLSRKAKKKKAIQKSSIVDDKFFKLGDLEHFLNSEDKKEMKPLKNKKHKVDESSDDDESVDLFEDNTDSSHELGDMEDGDSAEERPKYKDFFDDPDYDDETMYKEGDDANIETGDINSNADEDFADDIDSEPDIGDLVLDDDKEKKVRFDLNKDSDSDDSSGSDLMKDTLVTQNVDNQLSTFELRQERLKKKIGHLEENLISEKPWQMRGEVDASKRPQNSLLQEIVDFDLTSRPAPIITEETTYRLEDIIIQRIKDKAWDDVERKAKPTKDPMEFKKSIVLDQEKSKASLAQIYEQEYMRQKESLNPDPEKPEEEPKEHKEIREMMRSLLSKLNALSNYHYTPKPAIPEVKIVSNIPAITMEEVAPVATSDAALLAPEEVKTRPKGDVIGKSERTDTDKKRERRKKKLKQKEREKQRQIRENDLAKSQQSSGAFNKKSNAREKKRLLKSVTKARNVFVAKPDKPKSAKTFKL